MSPSHLQSRPSRCLYPTAAGLLIAFVTALRFWYAGSFELTGDEAYYWLWSKNLDYGYFSKGPGVAWTIALGTLLLGDSVPGVRLFAVLLSAGTGAGVYLLARNLYSPRVGFWSVVTILGVPLFGVRATLMTIDPLSVFFWTVAALAFWKAINSGSLGWWAITGLLIGLGALCKYTNLFLLPGIACFCGLSPKNRHALKALGFWLMVAVALLCLLPPVHWNAQHGWPTIAHLISRGGLEHGLQFHPLGPLEFIAVQAAVISPFLFAGIVTSFWNVLRAPRAIADPALYLLCISLPLWTFYAVLSFNEVSEPNWAAPAYVGAIMLLVSVWLRWSDRFSKVRVIAIAGLAASIVGSIGFQAAALGPTGISPLDRIFDRTRGAKDLAEKLDALRRRHGTSFFITGSYGTASLIAFYLTDRPRTFQPRYSSPGDQFAFWPDYLESFPGQSALYLAEPGDHSIPDGLRSDFTSIELIGTLSIRQDEREIRRQNVYVCREASSP